ncbi:cation:proton antiporter [Rhodococcus sp. IEGM 1379]|uniref:cation:proton antiporter n=1 Tax=Rhodococcus sp. IEGM 1379 TaxID=3047086 RepID=UPI0024B80097|nr:cation:proton antiporter [Rhodococcus sp. IEGM 1379]MDI9916230.1 cation:proton antiporter [Rhodococcus sp. IEGM 1379]
MPSIASSLFWIALIAALAPIVAGLFPRRLVPEVVLLLVAGAAVGPFALNIAVESEAIGLLRELGLGMLFLLAGYEIDRSELSGKGGRRALYTWLFCLALAFGVVALLGIRNVISAEAAVAIAMTSTALGTLLPILKDNKLLGTRLGKTVLNHGAVGELGPVVAMAVLLSARGAFLSLVVLATFALIAVLVAVLPTKLVAQGSWTHRLVRSGADTTAQTTVRLTVLLLVGLGVLSAVFSLDVILGAFAAGFILRRLMPEGDERLEIKLEGIAFGFLIPIFFITSGMAIDVSAVAANPVVLLAFLLLIIVVRGVPMFMATKFEKIEPPFSTRESAQVALYGATGLPMIVAVTGAAVSAGQMSSDNASILVAAGAITVLLLPMCATLLNRQEKSRTES